MWAGDRLVFGVRGNPIPTSTSLNETLVCVDSPVVVCCCCCLFCFTEVASAWIYLCTYRCSITEVPIFRILSYIIQILKRAGLVRLHPVVYLSSAFYTQQTNACLFSESYIYFPSCLPQAQKVVVSSQLHWLLVCSS